jgi:sterol 3beta-glucosyltransferase
MNTATSRSRTITILTMGSRGDVQPYVAIGRGLALEGYSVRIATLEPFRDFVQTHGLEFWPIPDPLAALEGSPEWRRWQSSEGALWDKLRSLRDILRQAKPALSRNMDACLEACRGSRVILSSFTGFPGPPVAALLGIPHIWALLQPCTPTRDRPSFLSPWQNFNSRLFNLASHRVAGAGFRWLFAPAIRDWQSHRTGRRSTVKVDIPGEKGPVIYGFSPILFPRPKDWGPDVHITGDWRFDAASSWTPPAQLADFIAAQEKPVCMCHSAITGWRSVPEALDLLREAARTSGFPTIIVSRLAGTSIERLSDSCIVVDAVPFEWLLPRVRLMVHHGGAGTSAVVLRAGRPSIVLPSCFDQQFWAHALGRLGAATRPLDPHRVTATALSGAICEAISDRRYATNAERCRDEMRNEDGVRCAVEVLRRHLGSAA